MASGWQYEPWPLEISLKYQKNYLDNPMLFRKTRCIPVQIRMKNSRQCRRFIVPDGNSPSFLVKKPLKMVDVQSLFVCFSGSFFLLQRAPGSYIKLKKLQEFVCFVTNYAPKVNKCPHKKGPFQKELFSFRPLICRGYASFPGATLSYTKLFLVKSSLTLEIPF